MAVPPAAVHALCSSEGCEKARKVCESERGAGAEAAPVLVMQVWSTSATRAPSASEPQEPGMNGATSTLCVRARVFVRLSKCGTGTFRELQSLAAATKQRNVSRLKETF